MKRLMHAITVILLITATTGLCSGVETAEATATIVPSMEFTKDVKTLSLDDTKKIMTTSSPNKTQIELHKKQTLGKAAGHMEGVSSFNELLKAGAGVSGTKIRKEIEVYLQSFARSQVEPNYTAEMNKLNLDTVKNYYTLKQTESQERIAFEGYNLKIDLLKNAQKKFELGTISNMELIQAQSALNTAKDDLFIAQNNLKTMKMSFNLYMGFDIMQGVTLTDELKQVPLPVKTLETSIREALNTRNEIKYAEHMLKYANLGFKLYDYYPPNSASYLNSELAVLEAEKGKTDAVKGVEMDVRNKYIAIKQKYDAITTGQKNVANTKESLRLAQLQYDVGMTTLTAVNDAQIALNKAEIGLSQNLLDYNIAVEEYNYASGVGTTTAQIN